MLSINTKPFAGSGLGEKLQRHSKELEQRRAQNNARILPNPVALAGFSLIQCSYKYICVCVSPTHPGSSTRSSVTASHMEKVDLDGGTPSDSWKLKAAFAILGWRVFSLGLGLYPAGVVPALEEIEHPATFPRLEYGNIYGLEPGGKTSARLFGQFRT